MLPSHWKFSVISVSVLSREAKPRRVNFFFVDRTRAFQKHLNDKENICYKALTYFREEGHTILAQLILPTVVNIG